MRESSLGYSPRLKAKGKYKMKSLINFIVTILTHLHVLTPLRTSKLKFLVKCHKWPNFKHPKDVNEKINWMKFYGDTSMWPIYADKYRVREFVKECGLGNTLIPLIGKWDSVDEIDWDALPNQFVMKCNNGSGDVVVCTDKSKLDIETTKKHFEKLLKKKLSVLSGELHYAKIKPCIIAEQMLDVSTQPCNSTSLIDYKVWVFDGKPLFTWCTWNRQQYHANVAVYDMDWNFHPEWSVWTSHYVMPKDRVPKPACFDKLMDAVSRLGRGIPVARIDMYVCGEKIYFGEITMTSQAGFMDFYTQEFLDKMGQLTVLPIDCEK